MNIFGGADLSDLLRHARHKLFRLDHAGSKDEGGIFPANDDFPDLQWF